MQFDAITAGVRVGGLNNKFQIKVMICFVANQLSCPIPVQRFTEIIHFEGIANYFEVSSAIVQLEGSEFIAFTEDNGDKAFVITQKGAEMLKEFPNILPLTIEEDSVKVTEKMIARRRNERENKVKVEKLDKGCIVSCSVMEGEREQLTVRLFVPDEDCAAKVIDIFMDDPTRVFVNVLNLMIGNE